MVGGEAATVDIKVMMVKTTIIVANLQILFDLKCTVEKIKQMSQCHS